MLKNRAHFLFAFPPNWSRYRTVHGRLSIDSDVFCIIVMLFSPSRGRAGHTILKSILSSKAGMWMETVVILSPCYFIFLWWQILASSKIKGHLGKKKKNNLKGFHQNNNDCLVYTLSCEQKHVFLPILYSEIMTRNTCLLLHAVFVCQIKRVLVW